MSAPRDVDQDVANVLAVVCTIAQHCDPIQERAYAGDVACPICARGRLRYRFLGRRGGRMDAMRAKCSTPGCVGFLS